MKRGGLVYRVWVRVEEMHPWAWYTIVTVTAVGLGVWLTWGVDPGYDGRAPLTCAPYDWCREAVPR